MKTPPVLMGWTISQWAEAKTLKPHICGATLNNAYEVMAEWRRHRYCEQPGERVHEVPLFDYRWSAALFAQAERDMRRYWIPRD